MAPEQAREGSVDQRADLFSLGSVMYAMATGRPPFLGESSTAVLFQLVNDAPPPIRALNPALPDWLGVLIARLHAKDPAQRYQSATEVAQELTHHLARLQGPAPRDAEVQASPRSESPNTEARAGRTRFPVRILPATVLLLAAILALLIVFLRRP